jgi:hypothetical protein
MMDNNGKPIFSTASGGSAPVKRSGAFARSWIYIDGGRLYRKAPTSAAWLKIAWKYPATAKDSQPALPPTSRHRRDADLDGL